MASFQVLVQSDRRVVEGIFKALGAIASEVTTSSIELVQGGPIQNPHTSWDQKSKKFKNRAIAELLQLNGQIIKSVSVRINKDAITFRRPGDNRDSIETSLATIENFKALQIIAKLQTNLVEVGAGAWRAEVLGEGVASNLQARESELDRLQGITENIFEKLADEATVLQAKFDLKNDELRQEVAREREDTAELYALRQAELDKRSEELDARIKEVDDRGSKYARRQKQSELIDKVQEIITEKKSASFMVSPQRYWVHFVCLIVITVSFTGVLMTLQVGTDLFKDNTSNPATWVYLLKSVGLGAFFVGVSTFYLRRLTIWSDQFDEEMGEYRQLSLDITRAGWFVEMAMEWKEDKDDEVPPLILEAMSRGLFLRGAQEQGAMHPVEQAMAILLGSASNLKLGPNGMEASLSPGRAKKKMEGVSSE